MSRKNPKTSLQQSFERALRATASVASGTDSTSEVRLKAQKGESKRRFIGKSQLDITYNGVRSLPGGPAVPWYIVVIAVGKIRHKFSLGAPATWHKSHKTPMDDALVDALACSAVRFAIDEGDDNVPDLVSEVVTQATDGHLKPDGSYTVRKSI